MRRLRRPTGAGIGRPAGGRRVPGRRSQPVLDRLHVPEAGDHEDAGPHLDGPVALGAHAWHATVVGQADGRPAIPTVTRR